MSCIWSRFRRIDSQGQEATCFHKVGASLDTFLKHFEYYFHKHAMLTKQLCSQKLKSSEYALPCKQESKGFSKGITSLLPRALERQGRPETEKQRTLDNFCRKTQADSGYSAVTSPHYGPSSSRFPVSSTAPRRSCYCLQRYPYDEVKSCMTAKLATPPSWSSCLHLHLMQIWRGFIRSYLIHVTCYYLRNYTNCHSLVWNHDSLNCSKTPDLTYVHRPESLYTPYQMVT